MNLRLLTYNIRNGGVGREAALAETIRAAAPDLVVLQEATHPGVVKRLAAATDLPHWASTRGRSVGFLSRIAVSHHAWHRPYPSRRWFLEIVLAGTTARVFGVHLSATHNNWVERQRVRELEAILSAISRTEPGFHVLAGDFNTLAPGETLDLSLLPYRLRLLALLGGRTIRWRTIQILLDAGYLDGFRMRHPNEGGHTFPTWNPQVRLDYVFVPGAGIDRLETCERLDGPAAAAASDHFPLLAELKV